MSQAPVFKVIAQGGKFYAREAEYCGEHRLMTVARRADRESVSLHCSDLSMGVTLHVSIPEARALAAELLAAADAVTHAGRA